MKITLKCEYRRKGKNGTELLEPGTQVDLGKAENERLVEAGFATPAAVKRAAPAAEAEDEDGGGQGPAE